MIGTNFHYNQHGGIDCDLDHPEYGIIPYTLEPHEVEAVKEEGVLIAPYEAPEVPEPTL